MPSPALIWPIPALADGRQPIVSSGFAGRRTIPWRNPATGKMETRTIPHGGVDLDYRAAAGDPPYLGRPSATRTLRCYGPLGVPVLAVAGGMVTVAGWYDYGGGILVRERAGPVVWFYAHLSTLAVKPGQVVEQGAYLGEMGGSTRGGESGFRHVHLSRLARGTFPSQEDPEPYLRSARVWSWAAAQASKLRGGPVPGGAGPAGLAVVALLALAVALALG